MEGKVRTYVGALVALAVLAGLIRLLTWAMDTQSYNTWGAMIWSPIIVGFNLVLISFAFRKERDRWIVGLATLGYFAKLLGIAGRYLVLFVVYGGVGDANGYNLYAAEWYFQWRQGIFDVASQGKLGTHNLELATTAVYTIFGPSAIVGFLVFGTFAYWGCILLLKAFREAVPTGSHRRYAVLLLLLPSFLYWPSSIGKESTLLFAVGVTALGAARLFNRRPVIGLGYLVGGLALTSVVRPHMTLLLIVAVLVAQILRPTVRSSTGILTKLAGVLVVAIAAGIILTQAAEFLGIHDLSLEEVTSTAETVGGNTEQGGSKFEPVPLESPLGVPAAIVTLLFRPFPWEARNAQMLAQSLEGVVLLWLTITGWRRWWQLPRLLKRNPYMVFAVTYTLAFILAFAGFANFGIVARQRVLMMPFFLTLLALPDPRHSSDEDAEDTDKEYIDA